MSDELPDWIRVDSKATDLPEVLYLLKDESEFKKLCGNDEPKNASDEKNQNYNYCFAKYDGTEGFGDINRVYYKKINDETSFGNYIKKFYFDSLNPKFFSELNLLWKGAINEKIDGNTPLHFAAILKKTDVVKAIISARADMNIQNESGRTPLYAASHKGHYEIVEALLKANADMNIPDELGWTPLHVASDEGHYEIVEALLEADADPILTTNAGFTPLKLATESPYPEKEKLIVLIQKYIDKRTKKTP